ncbi:NUDIX hydrolase [Halobacterium sp. DL1]|jgi:8-oxo-dGTP diphosphatase|nr:NUDIX hydrolase [Halobacterium sp. DL1]
MDEFAYVVNVDAAVVRDGEYLVIERSAEEEHAAGTVAFPGGKVEQTEGFDAIENTARREVREETGVEVGAVEYVSSNAFVADEGTQCLNVLTRCEYESGEPEARQPDEVADAFWLPYEEFGAHPDVPEYVAAFAERVEESRAD